LSSILIVEDREMISDALKEILTVSGYEVPAVASDGKEAIAIYKEIRPDLVLMDLLLPDMNGIDAAAAILEMDPKARFVAITAATKETVVEDCKRAGFKGLVRKPFRMKELLEIIETALTDE